MITDYYETFILQQWEEDTDGFDGSIWRWMDGDEIQGVYIQHVSDRTMLADAEGFMSKGTFAVNLDVVISENDVLRREADNLYIRIKGKPLKAPAPAVSKIKRFPAEIIINIEKELPYMP